MKTRVLTIVAALGCGGASAAENRPATPTSSEVIEMSPFSVTEDDDRGYAASSTLSGTRLKTSLRDTAAAISVITPELMQDLGLTNANQIASFMVNTELDPGSANTANNPEQNSPNSTRVRGIQTGGSQANFFSIPWTVDSYNLERLTQTRGPNSLLFGIGNSAGSITATSNRAAIGKNRPGGKVDVMVDENETHRAGFVPHTIYQDISVAVPHSGLVPEPPSDLARVVLVRDPANADRLADFEFEMQGIRRPQDFAFFLVNPVGSWRVWAYEAADGALKGFLVASHDPACVMLGPGVADDETTAIALLWKVLDTMRGQSPVFLVPSQAQRLVRQCYLWGGRNVELHAAQALGQITPARGIGFPTFLPESG